MKLSRNQDWLGRFQRLRPHAIVLTHAHPDHAFGLRDSAPCPVYATRRTWQLISCFPIADRHVLPLRRETRIDGVRFRPIPVFHSITAPAVGFRIAAGRSCVFYAPDIAHLPDAPRALRGVELYIGDGATVTRPMVWPVKGQVIGHAPIRRQLGWCRRAGVARAVFTHCGSGIVKADARVAARTVASLGEQAGVEASIARDGLAIELPWE